MSQVKQIFVLNLIVCCWLGCIQAQVVIPPNLDFTKLATSEPIWQLMDRNLPQVQKTIDTTKERCLKKLQMPLQQRSLISERNPTPQEKCLLECILKGIKIVDRASNRLNIRQVENLTSMVSDRNPLLVAISASMAHNCNRGVQTKNPCEAAHQLNQCISTQIKRCRIKLYW